VAQWRPTVDLLAALDNKNPSIKEETCKFLTRIFCECKATTLPKSILKQVAPALVKKLEDTVGPVRDSAAEALGTAMKVAGERAMGPYLDPLDKIKQDKVKEYFEKAELTSGGGSGTAPAAAAPVKAPPKKVEEPKKAEAKPVKKAPAKKKAAPVKKEVKKDKKKKKKGNDFETDQQDPSEPEMGDGSVEAKAEEIFGEDRLKQMASTNWKERLEAVEEMTKTVEGMSGDVPCQVLVRTLARKPGWKDSNFQVLNGKFKLLAIIASKSNFSRRSAWYAIAGLISKIADIKLKTQVKETLKVFAENISLNYISLKVAKSADEAKNPKLIAESLGWMSDSVKEFGFRIDLKPHIAFIKSSLTNTNPAVRKAAIEFLATLYIYVGANIRMFFEEEKAALLQQIDGEFEKVKDEKPPAPTRRFKDDEDEEEADEAADGEDGGDEADAGDAGGGGGMSLEDMVERVSISEKITEGVLAKIKDKNWKIRKEGLEEVQGFINSAKFIKPDIGELPAALKTRLSDNNKVLVNMTMAICKQLAESGGSGMSRHKNTILPGLIGVFSDAKPMMRKLAEEALDLWHEKIGFLPLLDNEILVTAMREANPNLRATLLSWLEKKLPNEKKLPSELKDCLPPLYVCLEDRSGDVRKAALAVIPFFMAHLGYDSMSKATGKLDPSSKTAVNGILEKAREVCVPIAAPGKKVKAAGGGGKAAGASQAAKSAAIAAAAASTAIDGGAKETSSKKPASSTKKEDKPGKCESKKASGPSKNSSSRKKDNVEDDGPSIIHKTGKSQRMKDEKNLKVLKWNFTTPRDEIVEQLKDQMQPCFSPSMHTKLFHKDFKNHIEAIAILTNGITSSKDAMVESLDIILKWLTLRFFDTNTSVLLKCLEFLSELFTMLEENQYQLSAYEGSVFIPYLILKIGDPKDNVRKSVRGICKQVVSIYPASKMFTFLMDGLTSKNSKSRMECLDELGVLINKFGLEVCQPSPKVLKEIAVQIGDRDNGVRSAALNCIVEAFNIIGESVYKLVGRLSDKDMGYLEERIKRAGRVKEAAPPKQVAKAVARPKTAKQADEPISDAQSTIAKAKALIRPQTAPSIKREFELDFNEIENGEDVITASMPKLKSVNIDDVTEAANIPEGLLRTYKSHQSSGNFNSTSSMKDVGALLDLTIAKISSADIETSMESLVQLEDVFKKRKTEEDILKRIDQYLVTALVQLKMLFSRHLENKDKDMEELERLLKLLISGISAVFDAPCYACVVSRNVLKDVVFYFTTALNEKILEKFTDSELSVLCVNRLLLKLITNTHKTSCMSACIKLLQELSENTNSSPALIKLVCKCIWKLTHLLPEFINEVQLNVITIEIHNFFKILPSSFWKARTDRIPQQSLKALLQTLCKLRSDELLQCLSEIEDPKASEVPLFITKHCSKSRPGTADSQKNEVKITPKSSISIKDLQATEEVLVEIFRKIGSKENSRAGLLELYYFKEKFPSYNVDPFIKSTSPFFQNFIDRSLKTIAIEEKAKRLNTNVSSSSGGPLTSSSIDSNISTDSAKYLDRLEALKEKYKKNIAPPPSRTVESPPPVEQIPEKVEVPIEAEDTMPKVTTDENEKKNFDLGDIKRRLELIKAGKK